ncbi:MAG: TauD/TfdA family dioxygenase, partial [Pseudomonadota bacterium]
MSGERITFEPLATEGFGSAVTIKAETPDGAIQLALDDADRLRETFDLAGGLMVIRGLDALVSRPEAFVDIARIFGPEVENVRETLTAPRFFHPDLPEIMRLANTPPCRHPPPRRAPAGPDGGFEVRHPHQTNWHTDQSYRRPPPDVTLLLAVTTPPADQGQTLYADCSRALAALPGARREAVSRFTGIHAAGWTGRRREDARAGVPPKPLLPHQVAQCHP